MLRKSTIQAVPYFLLLTTFLLAGALSAQNYDIHIKTGQSALYQDFDTPNDEVYEYPAKKPGSALSVGLSAKRRVKGWFWAGIEGGYSYSESPVYFEAASAANADPYRILTGTFRIEQRSAVFLLEGRYGKKEWLQVNIGGGLYEDFNQGFRDDLHSVIRRPTGWEVETSDFSGYHRKSKGGMFIGLGFSPTVWRHLYVLGEIRFQRMFSGTFSDAQTTIRYHYLTGNLGVGMRF